MVFSRIKRLYSSTKKLILKSFTLILSGTLLAILSSVLYLMLYHLSIPDFVVSGPLDFLFSNCEGKKCDFPEASIDFSNPDFKFNFKRGEDYEFIVDLVVPETDYNDKIGMFVIAMKCEEIERFSREEEIRSNFMTVKKSTMLRYKSPIIQTLSSLFYSPLLVLGLKEEAQTLSTTLISNYQDKPGTPISGLTIIIESLDLNFYEAHLTVRAKLQGFKYYMYHYPLVSFFIGVPLLFPILIVLMSVKAYCISQKPFKLKSSKSLEKVNKKNSPSRYEDNLKIEELGATDMKSYIDNKMEETSSDPEFTGSVAPDEKSLDKGDRGSSSSEIEILSVSPMSGESFDADDDDEEGSIEVLSTLDTSNNKSSSIELDSSQEEKTIYADGENESFEVEKMDDDNY